MTFRTKTSIRFFARPFFMFLTIAGFFITSGTIYYAFKEYDAEMTVAAIVDIALLVFGVSVFWRELLEKLFAKIKIADDTIIWKCIFRRKHIMRIQDCRFIGVELENSFNQLDYPYIYFTKIRYPKEYEHKINELKNTDDFIKFWYTEELAEYLLTHFPKERTGSLQYYRFSQEMKYKRRSVPPKNKKRKKK